MLNELVQFWRNFYFQLRRDYFHKYFMSAPRLGVGRLSESIIKGYASIIDKNSLPSING